MFEPQDTPRLFATPLGVDFSCALLDGLDARVQGQPPEALARVDLYVNTARTQRRLRALYAERGAGFLPRIRLITDLGTRPDMEGLPAPVSALRLRLQIAGLVAALLDRQPALAPRSSLFGLADALADLMAEMQEERVRPETVAGLDVSDHSDHWQRAQAFLKIVTPYFMAGSDSLSVEARQSGVVDQLATDWAVSPPAHPIIVAGSTGSRGPTARFMAAVARLPQGAVILPGLDFDQPRGVWDRLNDGLTGEDHPQFRFARLARDLGLHACDIARWSDAAPANVARNRLISLALRPAPVTDQWLSEGPDLPDVAHAADGLTLIEAPSPQAEAATIALRLRKAADAGITAALITPDRALTRQVTAALDRWRIEPDDSGGEALSHSAPGRLLRHVAEAGAERMSAEALLVLLKHPLTHAGRADRGPHLLRSRDLELQLLRGRTPFPTRADLIDWARKRDTDPGAVDWAGWVADAVLGLYAPDTRDLADHVAAHLEASRMLVAGPEGGVAEEALWGKAAGQKALQLMQMLETEADAGGPLSAAEYRDFVATLLAAEEAREPLSPHPGIMIWGTLEARVQGADLVILGGLNEGSWPQAAAADPWLNRTMRAKAGLRLPDRVIGLAAHDFQQSVTGAEVWLTRSRRDAETETVPSRWLNRITNLMAGASGDSKSALAAMRARGEDWLSMALRLDEPAAPTPPATRPAPSPPIHQRPDILSVTQIEKLIRDPYAVYAGRVLRLRRLDPLRPLPDAPLRGTILHDILRQFIDATRDGLPEDAEALLMQMTEAGLANGAPWPAARRIWLARMARIAPWFIETERARRAEGRPHLMEHTGTTRFETLGLTLKARPDRIDITPDGRVILYDYKTGGVPTDKQEKAFNKQLWLEAVMAERGAFGDATAVAQICYIGLGSGGTLRAQPVAPGDLDEIMAGFIRLITHFGQQSTGYTSRRAMQEVKYAGDFDHLARHGEWDETMQATVVEVGR